jgi:hypothetical protein
MDLSQRPTVPVPNSIVIEHEVANAVDLGPVGPPRGASLVTRGQNALVMRSARMT